MNIQKTIHVKHKGSSIPFWVILPALVLLILGGCANAPTLKINYGQSDEAPAILDLSCTMGLTFLAIHNESGLLLYNSDNYFDYYGKKAMVIELEPGQYTLTYRVYFHKTGTLSDEATIQMESGHLYKIVQYHLMTFILYEGWAWIEDWTTSEVVAGIPPPRDVKRRWQGLFSGRCRSHALDYLK